MAEGRHRDLGQPLFLSRAAGDYPPEEDRIHWRVSINDFGVEAQEAAE